MSQSPALGAGDPTVNELMALPSRSLYCRKGTDKKMQRYIVKCDSDKSYEGNTYMVGNEEGTGRLNRRKEKGVGLRSPF